MEKQTRINKYKELRDEMKEEVAIDRQVTYEQDDEDDDSNAVLANNMIFYLFFHKTIKKIFKIL